jgi:HSP20 family protein
MTSRKPPSRSSGYVGVVVEHAAYRSFSQFAQTQAWEPAVNVYQVGKLLHVCVDLAGIQRDKIDVRIEPGRLTVSGVRQAPEPGTRKHSQALGTSPGAVASPMKILSMEIDYGAFQRVVQVPRDVDLDAVHSEYRDGVLWITMPLK